MRAQNLGAAGALTMVVGAILAVTYVGTVNARTTITTAVTSTAIVGTVTLN